MQQIDNTQAATLHECIFCYQKVNITEYVNHVKQCETNYQEVACSYCKILIIKAFMVDHQEDCIPYIEYKFKQMTPMLFHEIECCICTLDMNKPENRINLCCGHQYHSKCIQLWFQKRLDCPICRQEIH